MNTSCKEKKDKPKKIIYECSKCKKIFSGQYKLNRHLNRKYPCDQSARQCGKCGKFFYDSSTRKRHEENSCDGIYYD